MVFGLAHATVLAGNFCAMQASVIAAWLSMINKATARGPLYRSGGFTA
jgi:hypothetical protein